jgi:hypothetical protein
VLQCMVIVRGRVVGERARQRLELKACVGVDEKEMRTMINTEILC